MTQDKINKTAEIQDASAALRLSQQYYREGNHENAMHWVVYAMDLDADKAAFQTAFFYQNGIGCKRNPAKARELYELAAKSGNTHARFNLAIMLLYGDGVEQDVKSGLYWMEEAAKQAFVPAQLQLGKLYTNSNEFIAMDFSRGAYWLEEAAKHGNAEAQRLTGALYMDGKGVAKDMSLARKWLSEAVNQGDRQAAFALHLIDDYMIK